jgi:uncharacterized membrane protein
VLTAMKSAINIAILVLCIVGALLSGVSLRNHYGTSTTDYCDLNETFNCDLVNRSSYSRVGGIPVALIGLAGYVFLFAISMIHGGAFASLRLLASFVGLGFALYLAYIEAYVLAVWCLLCIGSLVAITGIYALSLVVSIRRRSAAAVED